MNGEPRVTMRLGTAALIAAALVLTGAAVSFVATRNRADRGASSSGETVAAPSSTLAPPVTSTGAASPLPDVVVSLTSDAVERAGILITPVASSGSAADMRLPGVVEPNAYRQVTVTSLVAGRITAVSAQLGARVRQGEALAQIYSPELAEAQTKYVSARAMLDAHDRELQRTAKLVEIGAASRQEMERIHAEHAAQTAAAQSARSQLELLGVPASTIEALGSGGGVQATTSVPAPIDGVVTARMANVGLNVDQSTALFTVVDLSTVWITADVYEKDFSRVRVGSDATIATVAFPGLSLSGRISYIDPLVNPETRTAKIRVEVPNPRGELRLGMYTEVVVTRAAGAAVPVVARAAVQNVGDRTVVYLANPEEAGTFIEREVRLGQASGEQVEVASGVRAGDAVVTEGSFFLRAERERLGLRPAAATAPARGAGSPAPRQGAAPLSPRDVKIVVNEQGFDPARVTLRAGTPARLTFVRTTDNTCATEVAFPSLNVTRALPLNEAVLIEFTPAKSGEIAFACGMKMFSGAVVVE